MNNTQLAKIDNQALAALRARAEIDSADTWQPEIGETLEGVLIGSRVVANPFGGTQHQAVIRTPGGDLLAFWLNDWLMAQMQAHTAELGDLISLRLLGKSQSMRGSTYNRYALSVLKAEAVQ